MISEESPKGLHLSKTQDSGVRSVYTSKNGNSIISENKFPTREEADNIAALKTFADKGDTVVLLRTSDQKGARTADSTINGVLWEVKTNIEPTSSAIDSALHSSNGQAKNLIINVVSGITDARLLKGLKERIKRTRLEKIVIERKGVIVKTYLRKDLLGKKKNKQN